MIDLYTWSTPNGFKISIALEELGLPYEVHPVRIGRGEQFRDEFLRISPNNKIPAIVDREGPEGPLPIFESGAILIYLAEKTGRLLPSRPTGRSATLQWLMFQVAGVGPMLGQAHHFLSYAPEKIAYAIDRYTKEARRLCGVVDRRLGEAAYLAGDEYTIADIATYPWLRAPERLGLDVAEYPHLARWRDAIAQRPAVVKGLTIPSPRPEHTQVDAEAKEHLFGSGQYVRR
jgi:GST-like protein